MNAKKRKIIQIETTKENKNNYAVVYALCNDGTVWFLEMSKGGVWKQLPKPKAKAKIDK